MTIGRIPRDIIPGNQISPACAYASVCTPLDVSQRNEKQTLYDVYKKGEDSLFRIFPFFVQSSPQKNNLTVWLQLQLLASRYLALILALSFNHLVTDKLKCLAPGILHGRSKLGTEIVMEGLKENSTNEWIVLRCDTMVLFMAFS